MPASNNARGAPEPAVFVAMSIMMIAIGLLASYVPARRASNVAAIESLLINRRGSAALVGAGDPHSHESPMV